MSEVHLYPVPDALKSEAAINLEQYKTLYKQSIDEPKTFWAEQAEKFLTWFQPWSKISKSNMEKGEVAWFIDGKLFRDSTIRIFAAYGKIKLA